MARGPRGEKRPADVIGAAIMVAKIATGEITEGHSIPSGKVRSGIAGGRARAASLSTKKKREIAIKAAKSRWK
jgi:hypothetical protein